MNYGIGGVLARYSQSGGQTIKMKTSITEHRTIAPTADQYQTLVRAERFLKSETEDFMIIQGAAGTGKSTITRAITDYLKQAAVPCFAAAPTGRAAKIIQSKTGVPARTVHSLIYNTERSGNGRGIKLVRKTNSATRKSVYIIDEASMISDRLSASERFISSQPLLTDLIAFVKQGNAKNKLILIGDHYQLPPVTEKCTPALDLEYLRKVHRLSGSIRELKEVVRHQAGSYILGNATRLRHAIQRSEHAPVIQYCQLGSSTGALRQFGALYDPMSASKVVVIAWRNHDVNVFNQMLRELLGYADEVISAGDQMILHTNWFYNRQMLLKGESVFVTGCESDTEIFAGLRFKNISIRFTNTAGEQVETTAKVLVDSLLSADGNLTPDQENALVHESIKRNKKYRDSLHPEDDAYVGALRLRYGYAMTCHRAQGGEWEHVILHPWFNRDDLKWQYTAITRASKELYTYQLQSTFKR